MSILGPTGGGRFVTPPDTSLSISSPIHSHIHEGRFYTFGMKVDIGADTAANVLIQTGSLPVHAIMAGTVSQNMSAEFWEDTVFSDPGSGVLSYNRLRSSDNLSLATLTINPTSADFGTRLFETFIPGGQKQAATGGAASTLGEWILSPNTNYLMRIINNIVSPSAVGIASLSLEYYESET